MASTLQQKLLAKELKSGESYMEKLYSKYKEKLFSKINGKKRVLEIGPGTGVNLRYYPKTVKWVGLEPNQILRKAINDKSKKLKIKVKVVDGSAMKMLFKDNSFDYVISTLVLCSVDAEKALTEVKRVLKKGGKFLFFEHVADKKGSFRRKVQNIAAKSPWVFFGDGCKPNKDIGKQIKEAGFKKVVLKEIMLEKTNIFGWVVKPHVLGYAIK